jgi:hypothetical protein
MTWSGNLIQAQRIGVLLDKGGEAEAGVEEPED